jgi:acyl carrier protein
VVTPYEFTPGRERLVAYVVSDEGCGPPPERELRDYLESKLPPYMVPARVLPIDALPLTTNGKVDYRALPDPTRVIRPGQRFRSDLERQIAQVWQEVLRFEDFGRDDKFFDAGGDSLDLGTLSCKLQEDLGITVSVMELIEHPTIAGLAGFLALKATPGADRASADRGRLRRESIARRRRSA